MRCIWCDFETTSDRSKASATLKFANKEHIIPEAVGGLQCLEVGKVCMECNEKLGNSVDGHLKTENIMMLQQYQVSSGVIEKPIGKTKDKERRARKLAEMKKIVGYSNGVTVERFPEINGTVFTGSPSGTTLYDYEYNNKFSRALHKCALNIILHESDYFQTKKNHSELINFIKDPGYRWPEVWSYAVCYRNLFAQMHFEPFWHIFSSSAQEFSYILLVFPCAIFIVGTKPNFINPKMLENIEKIIPENLGVEGFEFNTVRYFSWEPPYRRTQFGERFKFTFIKKEIQGEPNPEDAFYLLTKCWTCGQTNPTGTTLGKDVVFNGNQSQTISGHKNSWNRYSRGDLLKKGWKLDAWGADAVQAHIEKEAISYPAENDVKKLNIKNCTMQCLNCGWPIQYSAADCFL